MAKDRKKLQHIHSSIPDRQPTPATLEVGEIAVNNAANQEFLSIKNSNDRVVRFSSDEQVVTWMEMKDVIPYSGIVDNVHLDTNRSNVEIKLNQVVAENTIKHDIVNGAKDIDGDYVNPTEDSGVTNGAGFVIDMSIYAMQGANPTFSGITNTCYTELNGRTEILGGSGTEGSCRSLLNIDVLSATTNASSAWTTVGTADTSINSAKTDIETVLSYITSANTTIGTEIMHVSGTTTEIHDGDVTITNNNNKVENTYGNVINNITGNTIENIDGKWDVTVTSSSGTELTSCSNFTINTNSFKIKQCDGEQGSAEFDFCDGFKVNSDNIELLECTDDGKITIVERNAVISGENLTVNESGNTEINTTGNTFINNTGNTTVNIGGDHVSNTSGTTIENYNGTVTVNNLSAKTENTIGINTVNNINNYNVNTTGITNIISTGNTNIHSNANVCETADANATFYGNEKTNIGLNCTEDSSAGITNVYGNVLNISASTSNTTVISSNTNITSATTTIGTANTTINVANTTAATTVYSGQTLNVTEEDTDITSCGHLYVKTDDFKLEQCDGGSGGGSAEFKFCDGFTIDSNAITLEECEPGGSILIKETTSQISGSSLTIDEYDDVSMNVGDGLTINTSGDTHIASSGSTSIHSEESLGLSSRGELMLVSSEGDIIITANDDICETAGNSATFYGVSKTNLGLNCDDSVASTETNLNGDKINISGDTTDITSCGHLYIKTNDYKLEQCDGGSGGGSAEFKFCDGFTIDSNAITLEECDKGDGTIIIKETNTEISGNTLVINEGDDITINAGDNFIVNVTGETQITSAEKVCITSGADANFGGDANTRIGSDCNGTTGYSNNTYITASSSAFTYAPNVVNSGTTNNNTFTTINNTTTTENNNITTINTSATTINTTATTINQSGDTYNVTANTETHNTTAFTVNSASAACIVSNDVASIGGDVTTNVGANCQGDAISNVTNIYGTTINQSGDTYNITGDTNISGDTYISGEITLGKQCSAITSTKVADSFCEVFNRSKVIMTREDAPSDSRLSAIYRLWQDNTQIGYDINVPKDGFLKSVELVDVSGVYNLRFTWWIYDADTATYSTGTTDVNVEDLVKEIDENNTNTDRGVNVDVWYNDATKMMNVSATTKITINSANGDKEFARANGEHTLSSYKLTISSGEFSEKEFDPFKENVTIHIPTDASHITRKTLKVTHNGFSDTYDPGSSDGDWTLPHSTLTATYEATSGKSGSVTYNTSSGASISIPTDISHLNRGVLTFTHNGFSGTFDPSTDASFTSPHSVLTLTYGTTSGNSGSVTYDTSSATGVTIPTCASHIARAKLSWEYGNVCGVSGNTYDPGDNCDNEISSTIRIPGTIADLTNDAISMSGGCSGDCITITKDICMGDNTIVANGFFSRSDIRSKENIADLTDNDLEKVEKVAFKSFNFKSDEAKTKTYGVIAQDVKAAGLDNIIHKTEDGILNVDYTSLLLLKIARMEKIINDLRINVDILTDRLNFGK